MGIKKLLLAILILFLTGSCGLLSNKSAKLIETGQYSHRIDGVKQNVYLSVEEEAIHVYPMENGAVKDLAVYRNYPKGAPGQEAYIAPFWQPSFDIDFFTIPLKYRPARGEVPAQLNADLNGSIYLGYRLDRYKLRYETDRLGRSALESSQFGFSFGAFTGIGNTFMSPTTTNERIEQEYDGVVWLKGIAGIIAVNEFTVGIAFGFDTLLDGNSSIWVYDGKPWLGFALGVSLN